MGRTVHILVLLILLLTLSIFSSGALAEVEASPVKSGESRELTFASNEYVYFSFIPEKTAYYSFTTSGDADTYGSLYDNDMVSLARSDDDGEGRNFLIRCSLNRGTRYILGVKRYRGAETCILSVTETVHSGSCGENVTWSFDGNGLLSVTGQGAMENYNGFSVPWKYLRDDIGQIRVDAGVTEIGGGAFRELDRVRYLELPVSVVRIGSEAFSSCTGLVTVIFPDSLTDIGDSAFSGCSSLTDISLPSSLANLGKGAFAGCSSLEEIAIPGSAGTLQENTFSSCTGLKRVEILEGIMEIGEKAFWSCWNLKEMTLPSSLKTVSANAFAVCYGLETVNCALSAAQWKQVAVDHGNGALQVRMQVEVADSGMEGSFTWTLSGTGKLTVSGSGDMPDFEAAKSMFGDINGSSAGWDIYKHVATSLEISEGVTRIGSHAFVLFQQLQSASLPDSVTSFGRYAFYRARVPDMDMPANLTSIEYAAMSQMDNLMDLKLPETLTNIEAWAFGNSKIRQVHIPLSMKVIPDHAFYSMPCLCAVFYAGTRAQWEQIDIQANNESLGKVTIYFAGDSYTVASSGTCGDNIYWTLNSEGLLTIRGSGKMWDFKKTTSSTGGIISSDYLYSGAISSAPWGSEPQKVKSIVVEPGVTGIGNCAFLNCFNVTSVSLPDTLTAIGQEAFEAMSGLKELTVPDSVTTLGVECFYGCYHLENIHLSASLTSLPRECLGSCTGLKTLTVPEGVESINGGAFANMNMSAEIILPSTLKKITRMALGYEDGLRYGNTTSATERWTLRFRGPLPEGLQDWILLRANVYCTPEHYDAFRNYLMPYASTLSVDVYKNYPMGTLSCGDRALELNETYIDINELQGNARLFAKVRGVENPAITYTTTNTSLLTVSGDGALNMKGLSGGAIVMAEASWDGYRSMAFCRVVFTHTRSNSHYLATLPTEGIRPNYLATSSISYADRVLTSLISAYAPRMYVEEDTGNTWYQELKQLTDSLTAGCTSDREKVLKIMAWVDENVEYRSPPLCIGETPAQVYEVYLNRVGNCQGFSKLAGFMLTLARVPVGIISNNGHMWNVVYVDGRWEMADAQAGAAAFYVDYSRSLYKNIKNIVFTQGNSIYMVDHPGEIKLIGVGVNDMDSGRASISGVEIEDFVSTIFGSALAKCTSLTSASIPEGVTSISSYAFSGDTALQLVTIPGSVKSIDPTAFENCPALTIRCSRGSYAHTFAMENGIPYELVDGQERILYLPESLQILESGAFLGTHADIIAVPETVTYIAEDAFDPASAPVLWVKLNSYAWQFAISHGMHYRLH